MDRAVAFPWHWPAHVAVLTVLALAFCSGCQRKPPPPPKQEPSAPMVACDPDNGGLRLPPGFCALVVADHFANLRDLAIKGNGDIYGSLLNRRWGIGGLIALRDSDGDGRADQIEQFGDTGGGGLGIYNGHLYVGAGRSILRYRLGAR